MRLDSNVVSSVRKRVEAELDLCKEQWGCDAACRQVMGAVGKRGLLTREVEVLENFFQIVWLFNHCQQPGLISKKAADDLTKMVEYSLHLIGIKPYVSHLSYLYGIFYQARGKQLGGSDNAWLAAWNFNLADAMVGNNDAAPVEPEQFATQCRLAAYHFQLGFNGESLDAYRRAEELARHDEEIVCARFGMIRCLRVLGETEIALDLAIGLSHYEVAEPLASHIKWEQLLLTAQRDDDVSALVSSITAARRRHSDADLHYLILATLWCYGSKKRGAIQELPRAAWIKRRFAASAQDQRSTDMLRLVAALEDCYSKQGTIFEKLKSLGDFLSQIRKSEPSEENVIFLAAVARWLMRVKQKNSGTMVMNDYQRCSHLLSQGRSSALFGLLADIGDKLNACGETTRAAGEARSLKSGMERTFLFIEMFAKLFLTAVATKAGAMIGSKSQKDVQDELMIKLSRYFVQYVAGAMKGPIHKFAQMVLNTFNLPHEAEANFKSVLWSKQILAEKSMRKVFEEDMGKRIEDVFAEFDSEPVGVGSVSQVYRARLKTGEEVAVKIQYPDLDKITRQDMAMFSRIFTAARWLFPRHDVSAIKKLLDDLIESEIDFRDELQTYLELQKVAACSERWRMPKVYPELSTRRVMTLEFIRGQNLYQFNETATAEQKTQASKAMAEFALRVAIEGGLVCVDPHPANVIFSDGKIYLIDFGFFMKVSSTFRTVQRDLMRAQAHGGEALIDRYQEVLRRSGQLRTSPLVPEADVREFLSVMSRQFNWETSAEPTLQDRFNELYFKKGLNKVFGSPDPEFFVSYLGLCQVFRTISRLAVPQPPEWSSQLADEADASWVDSPKAGHHGAAVQQLATEPSVRGMFEVLPAGVA